MRNVQLPKIVELKKKSKTYPDFNDTDSREVKAWNRCVTYFNAISDVGIEEAKKYAKQFSVDDKKDILRVIDLIKDKGMDSVRAMINKETLKFL